LVLFTHWFFVLELGVFLESIKGNTVVNKSWVRLESLNVLANSWNAFLNFEVFSSFISGVFHHDNSFNHDVDMDINLTWNVGSIQVGSRSNSLDEPSFHRFVLLSKSLDLLLVCKSAHIARKKLWHECIPF